MTSLTTLVRLPSRNQGSPGPADSAIPSGIGTDGRHSALAEARDRPSKSEGAPLRAIPSCIGEGPKYTFHQRPREKDATPTPGPSYVPPRFGRGAQTSAFHGYVKGPKSSDGPVAPGPLSYIDPISIGARKGRGFTVKGRRFAPGDEGAPAGPGPGLYLPDWAPTHPTTQAFHYRRPVDRTPAEAGTPGPGEYVIDRSLINKAVALRGRPKDPRSRDASPGPANYEVASTVGKGVPAFSIRPKCEHAAKEAPEAPYQAVPTTIGQAPKWSFGPRREKTPRSDQMPRPATTPGPDYMPPPFGRGAKTSAFHGRRDENVTGQGPSPGPGEYAIAGTIGKGKKFTMKARKFPPSETGQPEGPGPKYLPHYMDAPVPRAIHPLIPDPGEKQTGPAYVNIGSTIGTGPKISIGRREPLELGPGTG